jgi:hypothetical protein
VVLFIAVTALIATLRTQNVPVAHHSDSSALRRVMAGIAYIRHKPVVLGAISLDLFAVLLGGATALLPIYARDILHVGPIGLGLLPSAPALGAAMLGLNLARRPIGQNVGRTMFACVASFGIVRSGVIGGIGTLVVVGLWMLLFPNLRKVNRLSDVISS